MMKVMKFGGGCLKDERSFGQAAGIVCSQNDCPAVVVSAVSGVTDLLLSSMLKAAINEKTIPASAQRLLDVHASLVHHVIQNEPIKMEALHGLKTKIKKVDRLLYGVANKGEIAAAVRAHVLSYGERLSALIFAALLNDRGKKSRALESEEVGLITDRNFENATVDLKEFKKRFTPIARSISKNGVIPVITDFFWLHAGRKNCRLWPQWLGLQRGSRRPRISGL